LTATWIRTAGAAASAGGMKSCSISSKAGSATQAKSCTCEAVQTSVRIVESGEKTVVSTEPVAAVTKLSGRVSDTVYSP